MTDSSKIYNVETTQNSEDLSSVDDDVESISKNFFGQIDAVRSHAIRPNLDLQSAAAQSENNSLNDIILKTAGQVQVDQAGRPIETRAHAFYRMIGLPVMGADGSFFNPGFNPSSAKGLVDQIKVATSIDSGVTRLQEFRQAQYTSRMNILANQDTNSTIYALALTYPAPFNNIKDSTDPFNYDEQKFLISNRGTDISKLINSDRSPVMTTFSSGTHILKPFLVDPIIAATVQPVASKELMSGCNVFAVPFLDTKDDTRFEQSRFFYRTIIENILINRLTQPTDQTTTINNLLYTDKKNDFNSPLSDSNLSSITDVLLGVPTVSSANIIAATGSPSLPSLVNISRLIQQLKVVIKLRLKALKTIQEIKTQINFYPVPNQFGPEFGSVLGNYLAIDINKPLDGSIYEIKNKQYILANSTDSTNVDRGKYAGTFFELPKVDYTNTLSQLQGHRDELIRAGSSALRTIELVGGEVSGLGLVDILAIYIALWAMDIKALYALIDLDGQERMKKNFNDIYINAQSLGAGSMIAKDALVEFEQKIVRVLKYADNLSVSYLKSPNALESSTL
jgi:hypothetical protein